MSKISEAIDYIVNEHKYSITITPAKDRFPFPVDNNIEGDGDYIVSITRINLYEDSQTFHVEEYKYNTNDVEDLLDEKAALLLLNGNIE